MLERLKWTKITDVAEVDLKSRGRRSLVYTEYHDKEDTNANNQSFICLCYAPAVGWHPCIPCSRTMSQ